MSSPSRSLYTPVCKQRGGWGGRDPCKLWVKQAAQVPVDPAGRAGRAAWLIIFRRVACGTLFVLLPWAYQMRACHLAGDAGCQAAHGRPEDFL